MYVTCKVCVWPVCRVGVQITEISYVLLQVRTVRKYPYVLQCKARIPVFSQWATTSRSHRATTKQKILSPKWDYSRTLRTNMATDMLLTLRWWFLCEICWQKPHRAPHFSSKRVLQYLPRLEGKNYLGLDLDWYYRHRKVNLSMLSYVTDALTRFQHSNPRNLQHQPYPHIRPNYGARPNTRML